MFAVVVIHAKPFEGYGSSAAEYLYVLLNQGARFAVPYFFVIAGYLWTEKVRKNNCLSKTCKDYAKRISVVLLFWSAVYALEASVSIRELLNEGLAGFVAPLQVIFLSVLNDPGKFMIYGVRGHLWFLPALLCALAIMAACVSVNRKGWLLPVASVLYIGGLLAGSYAVTPIGVSAGFKTHVGPFVSTLFFVIGAEQSWSQRKMSANTALLLVGMGFALHMLEAYALWSFYNVPLASHDHLLGTVMFGAGVAALALAKPSLGEGTVLARFGPYMLGVYVVHVLFVDVFGRRNVHHALWEAGRSVVVFAASLLFTTLRAQSKTLKRVAV